MVLPGLLALAVPVGVGFLGGAEMLGGLLAGVTTCGVLMAIFQSNAGGAWDNAKKMIEEQGGKGTEAHKASVVGDTVGDPFKDTSGPSLNILLKLMSVVALVIAPSIALDIDGVSNYVNEAIPTEVVAQEISKEVNIEMTKNEDGTVHATVVTTTTKNGEVMVDEQNFSGNEEEVKAQIEALKGVEVKTKVIKVEKIIEVNS